jgi:dUTP pyrophosphatase
MTGEDQSPSIKQEAKKAKRKMKKELNKQKEPILKFQLLSEAAFVPERGTESSSGIDVFSPKDFAIYPGEDLLIPLDISFDIPEGYDLSVYNKSGVSTKKKLFKGAELIDSDYTGNVHVHLFSLNKRLVTIKRGDKIAQLVMRPVTICPLQQVDKIEKETERGSGGFGSTGETKN